MTCRRGLDRMNIFEKDCFEKKQIARSARNRVRKPKNKRCSLPCDSLTKKELMALNGPIITYKASDSKTRKG